MTSTPDHLRYLRVLGTALTFTILASSRVARAQAPPTYDYVKNGVRTARVQLRNGTPVLLINDEPVPPLLFFFNTDLPNRLQYLQAQVGMARDAGVHIVSTPFNGWRWDGATGDYAPTNQLMDSYLAVDPTAVFLLRIGVWPDNGSVPPPPLTPDDDIQYLDGTRAPGSAASEANHQYFLKALRALIQHYEASPYAKHILGYHVTAQDGGEWFPNGYREKGLDYSPVNRQAFRTWLRAKYVTDAALSQSWGATVTLDAASIPVPPSQRFPIAGAKPGVPVQAFYLLPQEQSWVDYSQYIADLLSSRILDIARAIREETQSKKLTAFFHGYIHALPGSMTGHLRLDRLLQSPDLDIVASPVSYLPITERVGGGMGGSTGPIDSVALSGKLWMNEDDLRTWLAAAQGHGGATSMR